MALIVLSNQPHNPWCLVCAASSHPLKLLCYHCHRIEIHDRARALSSLMSLVPILEVNWTRMVPKIKRIFHVANRTLRSAYKLAVVDTRRPVLYSMFLPVGAWLSLARALRSGRRGPRFKSGRPDQIIKAPPEFSGRSLFLFRLAARPVRLKCPVGKSADPNPNLTAHSNPPRSGSQCALLGFPTHQNVPFTCLKVSSKGQTPTRR